MGLERAAACLQGVPTVFETDIFRPIVAAAAEALGVRYEPRRPRRRPDPPDGRPRAGPHLLHPRERPALEREAGLRHPPAPAPGGARRLPDGPPRAVPLTSSCHVVAEVMGRPYPELRESVPRIQNIVREEEEQFLRNLENGLRRLNDTFRKTQAAGSEVVSGEDAFDLHQTYGIPVEITESLAADQNLRVDLVGLRAAEEEARRRLARHRPRRPPSSPPARSTRSRSHTTTAASSSATRRPRLTAWSSASSSSSVWPSRPRRPTTARRSS